MVAGACVTSIDLFLRPLRFCEYHCARNSDVCALSNCDPGCRNSALPRCACFSLLFKFRRFTHSLWDYACADLFRRGLYESTNLVVAWADNISGDYCGLEFYRFYVVESAATLVRNGWILFNTVSQETWYQGRLSNRISECAEG